jgi:thiol-disulfide isomerase/thioredoxin
MPPGSVADYSCLNAHRTTWLLLALLTGLAGCRPAEQSPADGIRLTPVTGREILQMSREPGAKVTLVNAWASWCGPCRQEFPDLLKLAGQYRERGVRVVLVAVDMKRDTGAVKKFLARHGVDFPCFIMGEKDQQFINTLNPQWGGSIPATFLYDNTGKLRDFWEGATTLAEFEQKLKPILEEQR